MVRDRVSIDEQVPVQHHGPEYIVLGLEMLLDGACRHLQTAVVTLDLLSPPLLPCVDQAFHEVSIIT